METTITYRMSTNPAELDHLSPVCGHRALVGPAMVAEIDGRTVAAVDLASGDEAVDRVRSNSGLLTSLRLRRWEALALATIWGG